MKPRRLRFLIQLIRDLGPFEDGGNIDYIWDFFYGKLRDKESMYLSTAKYEIVFRPTTIHIDYFRSNKKLYLSAKSGKATIEIHGQGSKHFKFKELTYPVFLKALRQFEKY